MENWEGAAVTPDGMPEIVTETCDENPLTAVTETATVFADPSSTVTWLG
jgi:hypothetical protein